MLLDDYVLYPIKLAFLFIIVVGIVEYLEMSTESKCFYRKAKSVCIVIVPALLLSSSIAEYLAYKKWDIEEINNIKSPTPLQNSINSVKEGLIYSDKKAKGWFKDIELKRIRISFKDKGEILGKKGIIIYEYGFINPSIFAPTEYFSKVEIDMTKQMLVGFETNINDRLFVAGEALIPDWKIDLNDLFECFEKQSGIEVLNKYQNVSGEVFVKQNTWALYLEGTKEANSKKFRPVRSNVPLFTNN